MWLRIEAGRDAGTLVPVDRPRFTIGRDPSADLVLHDARASRSHARIALLDDGRAVLEDLGSTNGTFLDDVVISSPVVLAGTERVRIGDTELALVPDVATPTAPQGPAPWVAPAGNALAALPVTASPPAVFAPVAYPPDAPPAAGGFSAPVPADPVRLERSVHRANVLAALAALTALVVLGILVAVVALRPASGPAATQGVGGGAPDSSTAAGTSPSGAASASEPISARSPAAGTAQALPDLIAAVQPSTVLVVALQQGGDRVASGSGWVLDAQAGLIVTNEHVVNGGSSFEIGSAGQLRAAEVVAAAPCEDLAVLRVSDSAGLGLRTMPLGSQASLRPGETVVAVGYPLNASMQDDLVITSGIVSVVRTSFGQREDDIPMYPDLVQIDAAINPGNSGGPLVASDGTLAGMNTLTFGVGGGIQNSNYAIGVDRIKEIVPILSAGHGIGWAGLGFAAFGTERGLAADPDVRRLYGENAWPRVRGIVVDNIVGGTSPSSSLPRAPFLLTAINGRPLDGSLPGYCDAAGNIASGASATLTILLPGSTQPRDVTVTFE